MFLDSAAACGGGGRWDILVADPSATLVTRGAITEVGDAKGCRCSRPDPFALLRWALGPGTETSADQSFTALPFAGGVVGWLGYDLARRIERLPVRAIDAEGLPEMAIGIFDWALLVDHAERPSCLVGAGRDGRTPATGDPWSAYRRLRQLNPAPFSAYLQTSFGQILSSSPERFLALREGRAETRPIKGTRPRDAAPQEDAALKRVLAESPKDRAGNLMIVDLLRNDLGRVCRPGSIQVPTLFATESYASVHHQFSTITGELRENEDATSLLRACFPGGSITGAPKIRAMEITEALEPHRRGVYCGSIGYLGFDGAMDTNIAILTIVHSAGQVRFWSGAGLVHDSDCEQEYRETFDKTARLIEGLAPEAEGGVSCDG